MPRLIPGYRPVKITPRKDFKELEFRKATWEQGLNVRWERAMRCPCVSFLSTGTDVHDPRSARAGTPQTGCPECGGTGYLYFGAQNIPAIVATAAHNPSLHQIYGDLATGSARFSLLPEHLPGTLDRFTLLDAFVSFTEQRQRTGAVDALKFPIAGRPINEAESFDAPTVKVESEIRVQNMRRSDASGTIVGAEVVEGADFEVTRDGKIRWLATANVPAVGETFSIAYFCHPRYIARTFPHAFFHANIAWKSPTVEVQTLPIDVDCWLDWLGDPFASGT